MVLVLALWAGWLTMRQRNRHVLGTVAVDGTGFTIDVCKKVMVAGPDSIGVDLQSSGRNLLRLVRDEQGVLLSLYPKGSGVAIPVDQRDCSEWKVDFFSEDNDPLKTVSADVTFKCAVGGGKIDGMVFFEHCRP